MFLVVSLLHHDLAPTRPTPLTQIAFIIDYRLYIRMNIREKYITYGVIIFAWLRLSSPWSLSLVVYNSYDKISNFSVGILSQSYILWYLVWLSKMKHLIFIFELFLFFSNCSVVSCIIHSPKWYIPFLWIPIQSCLYSCRICLDQYLASTILDENSIHIVCILLYPPPYFSLSSFLSSFLSYVLIVHFQTRSISSPSSFILWNKVMRNLYQIWFTPFTIVSMSHTILPQILIWKLPIMIF